MPDATIIETYIADLREETRDGEFAFIGLQMVDISRTHITPARDRVFRGTRDAHGDHAMAALEHVVRSRELLAALLKRFDRVARDKELAKALKTAVKMYEVYVEKTQQLMRAARQNNAPRASTRQTSSTTLPRTATYQSCRFTVGSQ